MKKLITFLSLSLLLGACGMPVRTKKNDMVRVKGVTTKQFAQSDSVFQPYIEKFEFHGRQEFSDPNFKVGDIPINFGDTTDPNYDGVCLVYADDTKEIIIRESWWNKAHALQKEMLVFHELGHCRLGRTHDDELIPLNDSEVKASLMHPVIPDTATYEQTRDGYIKELFTYSRNTLMSLLGLAQN